MQKLVNNELVTLTAEEEAALIAESALRDTIPYDKKRRREYPSIVDQLDKIYHDGIDEWKKVIKVTKDKYPK